METLSNEIKSNIKIQILEKALEIKSKEVKMLKDCLEHTESRESEDNYETCKKYDDISEENNKLIQINRLLFNNFAYYCVMKDDAATMKKVIEKIKKISDEDSML